MVYMGSKAKITDYIVPVIQSHIAVSGSRTYIEPFCGGCNVIDKIKANNRIAADKNEYLIALFKHLQSGGKLPDAIGIPEEELRKAAKMDVCKINIDSDSRLAMTAAVRKVFNDKPGEFDPRKYLGPARDEMEKLYKHKIVNVLGSNGKA